MSAIQLHLGDCLEVMRSISDKTIDMILCDLPYGTTACKWDTVISFEPLWKQYNRVIKDNGAVALFGSEPFSSHLRMSNIKNFKYDWVWKHSNVVGPMTAKIMPMKTHQLISVFYFKKPIYNPQMIMRNENELKRLAYNSETCSQSEIYAKHKNYFQCRENLKYKYPKSVIEFASVPNRYKIHKHPTQKPVPLLEYLIKTYTIENETVLDNCMGSGSTGVACVNLNRKFIGIEKEKEYFDIAQKRINDAM